MQNTVKYFDLDFLGVIKLKTIMKTKTIDKTLNILDAL